MRRGKPLVIVEFSQRVREFTPSMLAFAQELGGVVAVHIDTEEIYSEFGRIQFFASGNAIVYILDIDQEYPQYTYWPHLEAYEDTAAFWKYPFVLVVEREAAVPPWYCDTLILDPESGPELCAKAVADLARANLDGQNVMPDSVKAARLQAVLRRSSSGQPRMDWQVLKYYQDYPDELTGIPPDTFERFVAEVMTGIGFNVTLTAATHDGGRDIIAYRSDSLSPEKILVECKQSAAGRTIGVSAVRGLFGVATDEKASRAIIVTTSQFSREAREFIVRNQFKIEAVGREDLIRWVEEYFKRARQKGEEERRERSGGMSNWRRNAMMLLQQIRKENP